MSDRWEHFNKYGHHFFGDGECSVCEIKEPSIPFTNHSGIPLEPKTWAKLIGIKSV